MSHRAFLMLPALAIAFVAALVIGERSDAATGAPAATAPAVVVSAAQQAGPQEQATPAPEPRAEKDDRSANRPYDKGRCEGKKGDHEGKGSTEPTSTAAT